MDKIVDEGSARDAGLDAFAGGASNVEKATS